MSSDDPITDAILGGTTYERLRATRFGVLSQPISRKLAWLSYILFALGALLPVTAALPAPLRRAYFDQAAAYATPRVAVFALISVGFVFVSGVGLFGVGYKVVRDGASIGEVKARELLSLENVCSLLGFGTGGFATTVTYGFVLLGFGGVGAVEAYLAWGGGNPFAESGLAINVASVALIAVVGALTLRLFSAYLYVEGVLQGYDTAL